MAFELANNLTKNYNLTEGSLKFYLPLHINNAISWAVGEINDELQ